MLAYDPSTNPLNNNEWSYPLTECVHVASMALSVGCIGLVDLRLLGLNNRERPFSEMAAEMLPWTWSSFVLAALAGLLMFSSKAVTYYGNIPFRIKIGCLALAGLNMALFQWIGIRHLDNWDRSTPPRAAKFAGAASLILWTIIVAAGRWIGFTT